MTTDQGLFAFDFTVAAPVATMPVGRRGILVKRAQTFTFGKKICIDCGRTVPSAKPIMTECWSFGGMHHIVFQCLACCNAGLAKGQD